MSLKTGSYFNQGSTHLVCQDYAINGLQLGEDYNSDYVMLSDGCSSAPDTDFGARLLVNAAKVMQTSLFNNCQVKNFVEGMRLELFYQMKELRLNPECLRATLMIAKECKGTINTFVFGDGTIFVKYKDGMTQIIDYQYEHNAPFYLSYTLFDEEDIFVENFGTGYSKRIITKSSCGQVLDDTIEGNWNLEEEEPVFEERFSTDKVEYIAIMSDGVDSFNKHINDGVSKYTESVPLEDVIDTLMDFKNTNGSFVTRHCQWMFKKNKPNTFLGKNWENHDDFSIGVIHCG